LLASGAKKVEGQQYGNMVDDDEVVMIPSLMILDGGSRRVMVDINQGVCSDSVMNI